MELFATWRARSSPLRDQVENPLGDGQVLAGDALEQWISCPHRSRGNLLEQLLSLHGRLDLAAVLPVC
jgi:hypothetical protein